MGSAAVAIEAIAVRVRQAFVGVSDGLGVAAHAVLLDDVQRGMPGADGVRDMAEGKGGNMAKSGLGFDQVFGDKGVRGMAIAAHSPFLMAGVIPAFVNGVHHVAIVAGGWVVPRGGG